MRAAGLGAETDGGTSKARQASWGRGGTEKLRGVSGPPREPLTEKVGISARHEHRVK